MEKTFLIFAFERAIKPLTLWAIKAIKLLISMALLNGCDMCDHWTKEPPPRNKYLDRTCIWVKHFSEIANREAVNQSEQS